MEVNSASSTSLPPCEVIVLYGNCASACCPCVFCNECLAQKEYYVWNDQKYCWKCFESLYGMKCFLCQKTINGTVEMNFIVYGDQTWHAECFKCLICGGPLVRCIQNDESARIKI